MKIEERINRIEQGLDRLDNLQPAKNSVLPFVAGGVVTLIIWYILNFV